MDLNTAPVGGMVSPDARDAVAELALIVVDTEPPEQSLRRVTELAKRTLTGVQDASLTMIKDGRPETVVSTGPMAVDLDHRQYALGSGPCLDAAATGELIVVDPDQDLSSYPQFAAVAAQAGVRHVVSVGLPLAQRTVGGLNLYKTADDALAPAFLEYARVFAAYAAVAVNNVASYAKAAEEAAGLRAAMQSRAVIEQAKGILIARSGGTADGAFDQLVTLSQHSNMKLRDLARAIVEEAGRGVRVLRSAGPAGARPGRQPPG